MLQDGLQFADIHRSTASILYYIPDATMVNKKTRKRQDKVMRYL